MTMVMMYCVTTMVYRFQYVQGAALRAELWLLMS